jgi:hypothetical protein
MKVTKGRCTMIKKKDMNYKGEDEGDWLAKIALLCPSRAL